MAKKRATKPPEPTSYDFETFRKIGEWEVSGLKMDCPACFNGNVRVRKYRIRIELIDEPNEVIAERIQKLWNECDNHYHWEPLMAAAMKVGLELNSKDFGKDRKR